MRVRYKRRKLKSCFDGKGVTRFKYQQAFLYLFMCYGKPCQADDVGEPRTRLGEIVKHYNKKIKRHINCH